MHTPEYAQTEAALRERVKELTCLYGISKLAERPRAPLDTLLQSIADLLPPSWQYPEIAYARLTLDHREYKTAGFRANGVVQETPIVIAGRDRGQVLVGYSMEPAVSPDEAFLKEERYLINEVARQVAVIIERREAETEKVRLEEQLRHADRLATIGQLAAGVAHELNEPLGNILGFAQLARKCPDLPDQADKDLARIETASLHAREVIRKLMTFAREMPPTKRPVDLNALVQDGLYFFEGRCAKSNIALQRDLAPGLPAVVADASQVNQVLINLVVNAIHAMPHGGTLAIATRTDGDRVVLSVADTGTGMEEDTRKRIFEPFFTTKDIHEGTGLGLAVVHGIVTSHKGDIAVESEPGRGARFVVRLPAATDDGEAADRDE